MIENVLAGFRRVLVLAPHTDDEMGCAGTLARLIEAGVEVRYVALSRCTASVPAGFPSDVLVTECYEATRRLGIQPAAVEVLDIPVRYFKERRQEILEALVKINRSYKPDLVFLPNSADIHQDHAATHEEGFRAFKHSSVLGYELPQNSRTFEASAFVRLETKHLETKLHSLAAYESQKHRAYATREFIFGLAAVRGVQANTGLAEAFEVVRMIF